MPMTASVGALGSSACLVGPRRTTPAVSGRLQRNPSAAPLSAAQACPTQPVSAHAARPRTACRAASPTQPSTAGPSTSTAGSQASTSEPVDDFATDQRPIILFDGVCNLCNGGVNFMLDNDPKGVFRLAALQSPAGRRLLQRCKRSPDDISSIVLVERDRHFIRSEAILRIGAKLNIPLPLLAAFGFPVPLPLRDAFYDTVANNRYSFFGRTDSCRLDDGRYRYRFLVN